MLKFFLFSSYILNALSQTTLPLVGGSRDVNNCLVSAGYTWCESSQNCIRQWETPCKDNYINCNDCLTQQRNGINIACPENCDMIQIDPMPPVYQPIDPVYYVPTPTPIPVPRPVPTPTPVNEPSINPPITNPFNTQVCSDIMCMMYCPYGHMTDSNDCQMCQCNDPPHINECPLTQPSCDLYQFVCPKITEITHCNMGGIDGYTTYQLSLVVQPNMNIKNIYAIYGEKSVVSPPMHFPPAYQSSLYKGQNIGGVSDYMIGMFPDTQFDSWLTIGITDGDPQGTLSSIGVDFSEWDETNGLDVTDGAIFVMNPSNIDISEQGNEIVIAQLTIPTYSMETIVVNVQGKKDQILDNDKSWAEMNVQFPIVPPVYTIPETIPKNCISWFDGCNTCSVNNGVLGGCTRMMCFREDTPRCLQYAANVISGH